MSVVTKEQIKQKIDHIPEEYLALLYQIIKAFEQAKPFVPEADTAETDWALFLEETYGSFEDAPLERGVQGVYEEREVFA